MSRLITAVVLGAAIVSVFAPAASAQAPPAPVSLTGTIVEYNSQTSIAIARGSARLLYRDVVLSADAIEVNLRTLDVKADGHVRLASERRTLVAASLVWNLRTREGELRQAATITGGVLVQARQVQSSPSKSVAYNAFFTTCTPGRPFYHVTAERIEVYPNDRLVAYAASLWIGDAKILTLRTLTLSLAPGADLTEFLPRLGGNGQDGLWIGAVRRYEVGDLEGRLNVRLSTRSGVFALNALTYRGPTYVVEVSAGRWQTVDPVTGLRFPYLSGALLLASPRRSGPVTYTLGLEGGWFRDQTIGAEALRLRGGLRLDTDRIPVSDRLTLDASADVGLALYGTGQRYLTSRARATVTYLLGGGRSLRLAYLHDLAWGATPFLFDAVTPRQQVRLTYEIASPTLEFGIGPGYDFLRGETDLVVSLSGALSDRVRAGVVADYNLTLRRFDDVDVWVRSRCDCVQVGLMYRVVRRQLFLEFSVATVFGPRSEPPPP